MMQFSSLKILQHVKLLWYRSFLKESDITEAVAEPIEAGLTVPESLGRIQKQIDEILAVIGS